MTTPVTEYKVYIYMRDLIDFQLFTFTHRRYHSYSLLVREIFLLVNTSTFAIVSSLLARLFGRPKGNMFYVLYFLYIHGHIPFSHKGCI